MVSTLRKTNIEFWKTKSYKYNSIYDAKDITDLKEVTACISNFIILPFKKNVSKSDSEWESFLNSITLQNLNSKGFDIWESEITEKDQIIAPKSMPNGKSP